MKKILQLRYYAGDAHTRGRVYVKVQLLRGNIYLSAQEQGPGDVIATACWAENR